MFCIFDKLFTYPQWFIAYRKRKLFTIPFDTSDFVAIKPPLNRFYADPFLFNYQGKNFIFFEEFCFIKLKGFISFVEIDKDGHYSEPQIVLERKYHLSYPFIFQVDNKIYMIPETCANNTIELYCAKNFPYDWQLEKTLMCDVKANDTTLWFSDQNVWMFTNIVEEGKPQYTDLHLFFAKTIFDEWKAHPQNPIISDIKTARPAGQMFFHDGSIIRPGQNSLARYGHSLTFNKLTCLTETNYSEETIEQVDPAWYPRNQSCHTYNFNEDLEVLDGEIIVKNLWKPVRKLASLAKQFL